MFEIVIAISGVTPYINKFRKVDRKNGIKVFNKKRKD